MRVSSANTVAEVSLELFAYSVYIFQNIAFRQAELWILDIVDRLAFQILVVTLNLEADANCLQASVLMNIPLLSFTFFVHLCCFQ